MEGNDEDDRTDKTERTNDSDLLLKDLKLIDMIYVIDCYYDVK